MTNLHKAPPLALTLRRYAESAPSLMRPHLAAAADQVEECARLHADLAAARALLFKLGAMDDPPCFVCGYNGPGYYDPKQHHCATHHHDAALKESQRCPGTDPVCGKPCSYVVGHVGDCLSLSRLEIVPLAKDAP